MDPLSFGLALSLHLGMDGDYNKYHPYIEYTTPNNYSVGAAYNSEREISFYAKKTFNFTDDSFIELGWATGYETINSKYDIPVAPIVRLGYEITDSLTIWAMPGGEVDRDGNFNTGLVIGTQKRF